MNSKVILVGAAILIAIGIFKPDFSNLLPKPGVVVNTPTVEVKEPADPALKIAALQIVEILKNGGSDRTVDGLELSKLYLDVANLISLDEENLVVKTTSEIKEINSVAGSMMNLKLKGKYPDFASTAKELVVSVMGDEVSVLNEESRTKAVSAFEALAWACYEGAK